ncbi:MAG: TIGR01777 family oxidoreductase [Algibacter sp.]|uniref:TIGR01777 family oxidoreductase n=1 Tax=Algibacter sp. TaxID=1872428 RepID=UPI00261491A6|nr:TIGR01777 family oxidoreductase [Algibacter sp.]MDG1728537.1 TIGR01777 family oxidoreductase [Algibacter sp.]MDG2179309.1 TIGR01777 family oxidoreductase [Algibacter sp.]
MRVLITGATGLIGQEIVKLCHEKDIKVNYLTTSKSKIVQDENYKGFYWNPKAKEIDTNCFTAVDAIIHLAGATVSKRWTSSYKKEIVSSRTETTALLVETLKGINHQVKQVISASAIGIYPDSLTNYYDQTHNEISSSFLGQVVSVWEQAVDEFSKLDITVSKIRIGLVLSDKGGALKEIVKPIKYGLGSAFGTGKQWQSWIHIHDLANLFLYVLEKEITGVYNGVAPNPVSNTELTKTAANILKKPLFMPNIPKFFMKLVLGEMHSLLFESQRVSSKNIENKGFNFEYNYLEPALENLLGSTVLK